jgi:hypothetical protein
LAVGILADVMDKYFQYRKGFLENQRP